jgi:YHS domain-containing protein
MNRLFHLCLVFLFAQTALAQSTEVYSTQEGAIRGYDPVAYFTENKPVKGQEQFKTEWKEHTWYFSSQKNMMVFAASPESYAPQYGGYCAYGMSRGYKAASDPHSYSIVDGKLYMTYSRTVQDDWTKQRQHYIQLADQNWPVVKLKGK